MSPRKGWPPGRRLTTRPTKSTRPWQSIGFASVLLVALVLLAATVISGPLWDARHPVVTIDGTVVDRTALRARLVLDADILDARRSVLRTALNGALLTPEQFDTLSLQLDASSGDPLATAVDGLVRDVLIRQAALAEDLTVTTDIDTELRRAAIVDVAIRVSVGTVAQPYADSPEPSGDWPRPAPNAAAPASIASARATAAARVAAAIDGGTPLPEIVAALRAAGWRVVGDERWLPATGPVADLPDGWVAAVRASADGSMSTIGPIDDPISGVTAVGRRLPDHLSGEVAAGSIDTSRIDGAALQAWAESRAAERALRDRLARRWAEEPQDRIRVAEVVIGSAAVDGVPGPYRSLAHLVVHQLGAPLRAPAEDDASLATRLAGELRAMAPGPRIARFAELVAAANATPRDDPLSESGEIGYFTRDQLLPVLADLAFAPDGVPGDILGPVETLAGPELFVLRARFDGLLDERSNAALVEARTTTDLLAFARRVSPVGEARRADGSLWRASAEMVADPALMRAYAETPIGARSEPVVIDGQIVVVVPLERLAGRLERPELDRLAVGGFEAWLAAMIREADIVRDAEPLPGVGAATPSPSASASPSEGLPTPILPSLPPPGAPSTPSSLFPLATPPVVP